MAKSTEVEPGQHGLRPTEAGGGRVRTARRRDENASPLSRERIIEAALALVDQHGLSALTFRRLGAALACEAMSIYHYFPSKRHLLDALVGQTLEGIRDPPPELDPIGRLRFLGFEYRAMAQRHPRLLPHAALHRLDMPAGVAFIERLLGHFRDVVPDDRMAAQMFRIFRYYIVGAALDEESGSAIGASTFGLGFEMLLKGIDDARATLPANAARAPKPVVRPKAGGPDA